MYIRCEFIDPLSALVRDMGVMMIQLMGLRMTRASEDEKEIRRT